jgi:hypothetical protein
VNDPYFYVILCDKYDITYYVVLCKTLLPLIRRVLIGLEVCTTVS